MPNRKASWGIILAVATAAAGGYLIGHARAAGIPSTKALVYSGVLTDDKGVALVDAKNIQIAITNADESLKCATDPKSQTLSAGAFSVELPDACVALVHQTPDLWVQVYVDGAALGKTKLGAVPYAVEAAKAVAADTASAAAGSLEKRLADLEAREVKRVSWGWQNTCKPLETFNQAGYTNVLIRGALFTDSACATAANDPASCHPFCASQLLNEPTTFNKNCCGTMYFTNGVVETLVFK